MQPRFYWRFWRTQESSFKYLLHRSEALHIPAGAGDALIEKVVRNHVYNAFDWTGQNEDCFRNPDSPVNLLQDRDKFFAARGRNPTISCGSSSIVYIGWLAFYGIPAREVHASHRVTGAVDVVAEWWCGSLLRWILTVPHYCAHFTVRDEPLSALQYATLDRAGASYETVAVSGGGKPRVTPDTLNGWRGMSRDMRVMVGNGPYAGLDPIPPDAWNLLPVLPLSPGEQLPHTLPYEGFDPALVSAPPLF